MKYNIISEGGPDFYFAPGEYGRCFRTTASGGFALYERMGKGTGTYLHCGLVGTQRDANQWIRGKTPKTIVRIYHHHQEIELADYWNLTS